MGTHFDGPKGPASDWRGALMAVPPNGLAVFSPAPARCGARSIARALLEEAAILGGGQVLALPGGDLLVVATAGPGQRAVGAIADVAGIRSVAWTLPGQWAEAEARCADAARPRAEQSIGLAALEAYCAALPVEEFARLSLFHDGTASRPLAQRLSPAPLGLPDPEMEAIAREALCRRLLSALTDPVQRGRLPPLRPGLRLILDLPLGGLTKGAPMRGGAVDDPSGPIALLPLASLADPAGFAATHAGLRAAGWRVGLLANNAAAMAWVSAPGLLWAVPAGALPPGQAELAKGLIVLGQPVPAWCLAPGIWHEGQPA